MEELCRLSATQALRRLATGELTAQRFARSHLDRIIERDQNVGAWAFVDREQVLRRAREIDRGPWRGKLHASRSALRT